MAAKLEQLIRSSVGLRFAAALARSVPPRLGYSIAGSAGSWIASRRDSALVKSARSNQAVVAGQAVSSRALNQAVESVFRNAAASIYDLYHYLQDAQAFDRMYCWEPSCRAFLDRPEFDRRGLVLAGLHTVGFDLGLRWLCRYKLSYKPLVLTIPEPDGGRRREFEERGKMRMEMVPGSVGGLRQALRHLQKGGMVMTGPDHPILDAKAQPCFFGRPAALPMHYIYLALRAHAPVVVVVTRLEGDGVYHVHASPPMEMDRYLNREDELIINAEKVLAVVEAFIRRAPQQWLMFGPVWPGATTEVLHAGQSAKEALLEQSRQPYACK